MEDTAAPPPPTMATLEPGPGSPHQTPLSVTRFKLEALDDPHTATVTAPPADKQSTAAAGSTSLMMDIPQAIVLTDDLIGEILSYLSVKTLLQLRTVCKAWKTLISNPNFVNLHLQRSPRNPHFTLKWADYDAECLTFMSKVLSVFPLRSLLETQSIILDDHEAFRNGVELERDDLSEDPYYKYGEYNRIVGSCNGLVCFYCRKVTGGHSIDGYSEYWLNFRNLAMGTTSEKLGHFLDSYSAYCFAFKFSFGYDNSTGIYKVVAFRVLGQDYDSPSWTSEVKIFNLGDNCWRKIQSFPVPPLICYVSGLGHSEPNDVVHLFGTINWLALTNTFGALHGWTHINAKSFVILSLGLSTETYTQLLLPKGLNDDLHVQPTLRVLNNCLCFSHDFRGTEFVLWQMREFGVRESWVQLIKVSYETLGMQNLLRDDRHMYECTLLPLYVSENSDTVIFANNEAENQALIYNWKDDRVERTRFPKDIYWLSTIDYVESLVPTPDSRPLIYSISKQGC